MTVGSRAEISGWVTPRLEVILKRAAEIANDRGYHYLGVEHVALAILDGGKSVPAACWTGPMTAEQWQNAIVEALPNIPDEALAPVTISVSRESTI
ncbi:MAG TPA: Clp protease N-terminal domain-containing protein [Microlunatus sp.]